MSLRKWPGCMPTGIIRIISTAMICFPNVLAASANMHWVRQAVKQISVRTSKISDWSWTKMPMRKVTDASSSWATRKELVTQEDLPYIVSDVLKHGAVGEKVKLKSYFVNLAHGLKPMATLKIEINGKEYEESSGGDGQYDAFVRALR